MAELYLRCTCASEKAFVCNQAARGGRAPVHVRPFNITHAEAHLRNAACAYESIEPVRIISVAICLSLGGRPANMLVVSTPKRPGWTVLTRCSPRTCSFWEHHDPCNGNHAHCRQRCATRADPALMRMDVHINLIARQTHGTARWNQVASIAFAFAGARHKRPSVLY